LVDGIRSTPWGAAGYELKVKPIGIDKWVHLMAVGTGVSQVLPVLVQGLLINPGSVLVLQEPGSQLHPALQQDLGDFLLACAKSGKQVVLETHSEYLVTRLARRIAEGADADLVKLLRVDYSEEAGTTYQPAPIDDYGNIEWPEGFFEEASDEAFKILDAGLAKQAAQED
jgi:predicted ATPase